MNSCAPVSGARAQMISYSLGKMGAKLAGFSARSGKTFASAPESGTPVCRRCGQEMKKSKCEKCGTHTAHYVGLILHDLRRTSCRNMRNSVFQKRRS